MADHQPDMGAQHGDVVRRRLRVGRTHADVDQRDPLVVLPRQVEGRHLRQLGQVRQRGVRVVARHHGVARAHQRHVAGSGRGQHAARIGHELVDVELVVGEQHVVLEVVRRRRGVVRQPGQAVVHALRGEGRQGARAVLEGEAHPVDDVVVGRGQVGHVEDVPHQEGQHPVLRHGQVGVVQHGEMHGDRRPRPSHRHRHVVAAQQQADLLRQVAGGGGGRARAA